MKDCLTKEQQNLVLENMNLVGYLFKKSIYFSRKWEFQDDIIQDGYEGLCLAAARYCPDKGVAFSTFASMYILGYMKRQVREFNYGGVFRISRLDVDLRTQLNKEFEGVLLSEITSEDVIKVSKLLNKSPFEISRNLNLNQEKSLDYKLVNSKDEDISKLQEIIEDDKSTFDFEEFELNTDLSTALNQIVFKNNLHKEIYFTYIEGARYGSPPKQIDLSKKFGVAQATVSRVIERYNKKLKEILFNE